MLEDEQNCSYNGGGDAKPLKNGQVFYPYSWWMQPRDWVYPRQSKETFSPIIRSQVNNIASAPKAIIEKHVAENAIIIIPRW